MYHYDSLYKVSNGDDLGSATYWNGRFQDLDLRLNTVEGYSQDITDAINSVTQLGLERVNLTIDPFITTLIDQINALSAQIAGLSTQVTSLENQVITDQNSVTNQLNALLAQAQAEVNNLQSLGAISDGTF